MNNFADNLKYLRNLYNLNQKQLGDRLNKDYTTIGKWENGTRSPTMEDTLEICNFFNISLNDLITSNLRVEKDVKLDESHKLESIILDKSKELTEEDKQKLINIIDTIFDKEDKK